MKKNIFPVIIVLLFCVPSLYAQQTISKEEYETRSIALRRDTAYIRFQEKLAAIMKTAKGSRTNYAEAKKLFDANKSTIDGLEKRYKLSDPVKGISNGSNLMINKNRPLPTLAKTTQMTSNVRIFTGPFDMSEYHELDVIDWVIGETGGKMTWTSPGTVSADRKQFGPTAFYVIKPVDVPDDPTIVGVRLEFDYSYYTTGWQSSGTQFVTSLGFFIYSGITSPAYDALSNAGSAAGYGVSEEYRTAYPLCIKTFTQTRDFEFAKDSSFAIEGYVTPGHSFSVRLAICYGNDTGYWGSMGGYHYGEFEIKKIVVRFLKAGQ